VKKKKKKKTFPRTMSTLEDLELWKQSGGVESDLSEEIRRANNEDIANRTKLLDNDIKVPFILYFYFFLFSSLLTSCSLQIMKGEHVRLMHEQSSVKERIKENQEKIKVNKQLPYLVANIVEVWNLVPFFPSPFHSEALAHNHLFCSSWTWIPMRSLRRMVALWTSTRRERASVR